MLDLEWNPSGRYLAAASANSNTKTIITTVCRDAGDPITEHEWNAYLHDVPYEPPCRSDGTPS